MHSPIVFHLSLSIKHSEAANPWITLTNNMLCMDALDIIQPEPSNLNLAVLTVITKDNEQLIKACEVFSLLRRTSAGSKAPLAECRTRTFVRTNVSLAL